MKRLRRLALWLFLALLAWFAGWRATSGSRIVRIIQVSETPAPDSASPDHLTVLIYNIAHGRGLADSNWGGNGPDGRPARLRHIAALLRQANADLVILNEVDFDALWSGHTDQALQLARDAGYPHLMEQRNVDASLLAARLAFGNALLSRHPIESATPIDLPAHSRWEALAGGKKRGSVCTILLPGGRRLRVLPVHWDTRSEETRLASAALIKNVVESSPVPCLVAGDFNSTKTGYPHAEPAASGHTALSLLLDQGTLVDSGQDRSTPPHFTFPSTSPARVIDWILASPSLRGRLSRIAPIQSTLSDHLPVLGHLDITTLPAPNRPPGDG